MPDVTQLLSQLEDGDPSAADRLLPLVYDELRMLAARRLSGEKAGQTLQSTALVHEAYIRLVKVDQVQGWNSRGHFYSAAAEAMRRILVDRARHKATLRAGGERDRVSFEQVEPATEEPSLDILALNEALQALEQHDARKAELVKLRYFAGLSVRAAAESLGIATSTAIADWAYAKGWLRLQMSECGDSR